MGAFEGHLSYDFEPRMWPSLDGNSYFGGETSINGKPSPTTRQKNRASAPQWLSLSPSTSR